MWNIFGKKPKKTNDELIKEREEKTEKILNKIQVQLVSLEKKKSTFFQYVLNARSSGLQEQEKQARLMLKQTMASIKRRKAMLMTLELTMEAKDLAQLNIDFLNSVGDLSEDIITACQKTNGAKAKKVGEKYMRAVFETGKQKQNIDQLLSIIGDYSDVVDGENELYSEFDEEIDSMIAGVQCNTNSYQSSQKI